MKQVLVLGAFEAFLHCSNFNKAPFYLREKQGILVGDERSSWCNRLSNFCSQFGIGERKFCIAVDQLAMLVRPTLLQSVRSMALGAMAVEDE